MTRDERELKWQRFQQHEFPMPSPDLAPYVARYWIVTWEYTQQYRQLIVPYPNVHLSFGGGMAEVRGVSSGHVFKELDGSGRVFGVAFQPDASGRSWGGPSSRSPTDPFRRRRSFATCPTKAEVRTHLAL